MSATSLLGGYDAVMRKHPHNPNFAHYKEKKGSWERYVKERCVLEPYYHGYVLSLRKKKKD